MNDKDIQEQPALIGVLAEDAQAGFEAILVPFLVYGIAISFGTVAAYLFVHFGLAKFVWSIRFTVIGFCRLFLPLYFRRKRKVKIQRASDRIFTALWGSIGFIIALEFVLAFLRKLDFTLSFFIIGILVSVGCVVSGTLIQKKASCVMYAEGLCWLLCAVFCLFVKPYTAPLIISAATFVLLSIPAFAGLLIIRNKKNYGRK